MRIGILTFQHSINFGAQLQCYALQQILSNMGHNVEVIRYVPNNQLNLPIYKGIGLQRKGWKKALFHLYNKVVYGLKMETRFEMFQSKHLNRTPLCTEQNIAKVANSFDAIIVGSDQVWGPATHDKAINFIGWTPNFNGKRISYAPCCSINRIDDNNKTKIQSLLNQFDAISTRNIETQNFVKDLVQQKATIVLDPTFLYDFSEFKHSFSPPYKKYIFAYIIGKEIPGSHQQMIAEIKKKRGNIPVIVAQLSGFHPHYFSWADKTYHTLTPDEWLSLIAQAEYFYTDSFHGVVFSVKFNVPFSAYYAEIYRKARFIDLAQRFYLEKNIVTSVQDAIERQCIKQGKIDFSKTKLFLQKEIFKSNLYLEEALK